jgi:hypothetical protein
MIRGDRDRTIGPTMVKTKQSGHDGRFRPGGARNRRSGREKKEGPELRPCIRLAIRIDSAACVSSLAFCGNLVPVSVQSQDDLMKVVRSWQGTLWKSAVKVELE